MLLKKKHNAKNSAQLRNLPIVGLHFAYLSYGARTFTASLIIMAVWPSTPAHVSQSQRDQELAC